MKTLQCINYFYATKSPASDARSTTASEKQASEPTGDDTPSKQPRKWRMVDMGDMKNLTEKAGKVFPPGSLIARSAAEYWPAMNVSVRGQEDFCFQRPGQGLRAQVLLANFRAGAEPYLEKWRLPIAKEFERDSSVGLAELMAFDITIFKYWPFKNMVVNNVSNEQKRSANHAKPTTFMYYFGDNTVLTETLGMRNVLTAYVFVLDADGKVRWKSSGEPTEEEIQSLKVSLRHICAHG